MSLLKIVGAVIVAVCGIVGTYTLNSSAKRSLEQIEGFISLVRHIRSQIECFSMPLPTALERCSDEVLAKCGYKGAKTVKSISELLESCSEEDAESGKLMREFAASIGRGYRTEQLTLCDYYIGLLETRRKRVCEQLPSRLKRNSAVCLCGALAVVILLI